MKKKFLFLFVVIALSVGVLTACDKGYQTISANDAAEMLMNDPAVILVDVRTAEEYAAVRIPGSVLLPLDDINAQAANVLPDKDVTIIVYCRSGNRSQDAASLLAKLGYENVYDMGGIINWQYEVISGNQ